MLLLAAISMLCHEQAAGCRLQAAWHGMMAHYKLLVDEIHTPTAVDRERSSFKATPSGLADSGSWPASICPCSALRPLKQDGCTARTPQMGLPDRIVGIMVFSSYSPSLILTKLVALELPLS
ncbi:hypothetical protein F4780DRAFT_654880 [Xylariomycetidae sp. FL0641]|nr:hypothetical protein F4780DRAFT_654880 [Xylariomycetidae sp. FL0641]